MIFTIAQRELKNLFLSPLAWSILAVLQLVVAFLFLSQLDTYMVTWQPRLSGIEGAPGVTDIVVAPLFQTIGFLLLLISPAITMRSISEEQRNRTLTLLLSAPVSIRDIVLGKFLGITLFFFILLLMLMAMPRKTARRTVRPGAAGQRICCHRAVHVITDRTTGGRSDQHTGPVNVAVDHRLEQWCR